ncbi:hypothetical protein VNO77_02117 [Canavalia gladiata]|uniref:Uncharacterized protein n=1 Tax=Canavalia gladiata TaxID=3824 RepID=A0AAN9RAZ5_CANGL
MCTFPTTGSAFTKYFLRTCTSYLTYEEPGLHGTVFYDHGSCGRKFEASLASRQMQPFPIIAICSEIVFNLSAWLLYGYARCAIRVDPHYARVAANFTSKDTEDEFSIFNNIPTEIDAKSSYISYKHQVAYQDTPYRRIMRRNEAALPDECSTPALRNATVDIDPWRP